MPAAAIQAKLPGGLTVDTFDGWAWLGVVPFVMERVRFRSAGSHTFGLPTARAFPELNLRTYVRAPDGRAGVYFFSLDAASLLAVAGARAAFGLPYFWAAMHETVNGDVIRYDSRRLLGPPAAFRATYRPLGRPAAQDDLRHFLTERYALFVHRFGGVQAGDIHHHPWDLQAAEAEIQINTLPQTFGLRLPDREPVLHYSEVMEMQAWTLRRHA